MLHHVVRFVILRLLRLFYPRVEVQGRELLPASGPILFVLNHPNGLLDPLLLMVTLDQRVAFLAKSTFFSNPLGRLCMDAFGALPVYRQQDQHADQPVAQRDRNETTFARCRALLHEHGALALFPEGTTHSGTELLPLKTGAARIALSAESEASWQLGLQIVPVGLWYQNKTLFRSAALLVVGQPFTITAYAGPYADDSRAAVQMLTDSIGRSLSGVVLQAENAEILRGMPVIAAWTAPVGPPATLPQQHARTGALLAAYERLAVSDPALALGLAQQARRYARTLRTLGIGDPWALELSRVRGWWLAALGLRLIVMLPLALAGFALSYGPYRLAGLITPPLVGRHDTLLGTGKLISGSALVLIGWLLAALALGWLLGAAWGLALFALAPVLGYSALRWGEGWRAFREALGYSWFRIRHQTLTQHLIDRRLALTRQVLAAMQMADALPDPPQSQAQQPAASIG